MDEWRTSSFSGGAQQCVQVKRKRDAVALRDSKAPQAGQLAVSPGAFDAVLGLVRAHRA